MQFSFLLKQLIAKEFKLKYKGSVLGVFWSVLNPLLNMIVLSIVFGQVFSAVDNYKMYLLSGIVLFSFFAEASTSGLVAVTSNFGLITKVYFPNILLPVSKVFLSLINMVISLLIFFILGSILGLTLWWGVIFIIIPVVLLFMFSMGMSLILSVLNVFFRDVQHLFGVILTIWMYATPILYPIDMIAEEWRFIFEQNPLYIYIDIFRSITMENMMPDINMVALGTAWALGILLVGYFVFKKNQYKFIFYT